MGEAKGLSRKQFMRAGFYGIGGLGVGKGFYNTGSSNIEQVNVDIKIKNLPPSFHGYKIAHMSDFHSSMLVPGDLLSEAVDVAMSAKPDMIALTGDFLTVILNMYHPRYVDRLADAFASMSAPSGIFAVMGNHDIGCGNEAMAKLEKALSEMAGVQWLRNKNVEIKKGDGVIDLIGTDDYWAQSLSLRESYVGLEKGRVRVMLSHNPDINELVTATGKRIDLILSGHTHGGQIIIPLLGAPHVPSNHGLKYLAGLVKDGERQTYVTRGVGHVIVPIRFNCPPEVTIITLV